jgi:[acyl-carrier-protein] S-malonyltransferase
MSYSKIAFLFPGQGAQYPGMGKDLAEAYPVVRLCYEEASDLLHRDIGNLCWEGTAEALKDTHNSQVGIYVNSIALYRLFKELFPHLRPAAAAGLSLGEYTAMTISGKIPFHTGLKLVDQRGAWMKEACEKNKGGMAVILGLEADQVEHMVKEIGMPEALWVANFNCPGQVVISGTEKGIEAGTMRAKELGAKRVIPLQVQGAFHSGLMKEAAARLEQAMEELHFHDTAVPIAMNFSGNLTNELEQIKRELAMQMVSPVRWELGIRALLNYQVDLFLEIGCGTTLKGLNEKIGEKIGASVPTFNLDKYKDLTQLKDL